MINIKLVFIKLLILSAIISLISCEKDLENVGQDLVDNGSFTTNKEVFEVIAYNENVEKSRVENVAVTNLGILNHEEFGVLKAGFVTQVGLPSADVDFGDNPVIDDIYIDMPYNYTIEASTNLGFPQFSLNDIYGDQNQEFNIKVYQLGTYLNRLDEEDPTQSKKYYSNDVYTKLTELHNSNFKPNANDTMYRVLRNEFTGSEMYDTIKKTDISPSIKLPLDKTFFTNNFLGSSNSSHFENLQNFIQHFNGLYFEVNGNNGALMQLDLSQAYLRFYYTTGIPTDETDTDLNGDGDTDDVDVLVRTKKSILFSLSVGSGVKNNFYNRDYSAATTIQNLLNNPNTTQGEEKLYLQGTAGSNAVIDIFDGIDLTALRQNNWLINEANLTLYIDKDASDDNDFIPNRLYLYKLDPDLNDDIDENTQFLDLFTEGEATFGGNAITETITVDEENVFDKIKYQFRITDYISEILKSDDPIEPSTFVLKTYHNTDLPTTTNDTIIKQFSWDPRGVILYGNNIPQTDANYNKRLKLEISYSELNN